MATGSDALRYVPVVLVLVLVDVDDVEVEVEVEVEVLVLVDVLVLVVVVLVGVTPHVALMTCALVPAQDGAEQAQSELQAVL